MDLFTALESGKIRYAADIIFSKYSATKNAFWVKSVEEAKLRAESCAKMNGYAGAVFVPVDGEIPQIALLQGPAHAWASPVTINGRVIGAIIEWSSEKIEAEFRRQKNDKLVNFLDFNATRHGE